MRAPVPASERGRPFGGGGSRGRGRGASFGLYAPGAKDKPATFIFVLTPAVRHTAIRERRQLNGIQVTASTFAYRVFLAVCVSVVLGATTFTAWRSAANRSEARNLIHERLAPQLRAIGHEYAHRFNRLSLEEQRRVLQRLLTQESEIVVYRGIHKPEPTSEKDHIFAPVLAFLHDDVAFVAAWMSRDWKMDLPSRIQGPRNSVLQVLRNTSDGPREVGYFDAPWSHLKIADANWDGRYRMFCLPQLFPKALERFAGKPPADFGAPAEYFHVGAFNFADGKHMTRFVAGRLGIGW